LSIHSEPRFAWDPEKAAANFRVHGVAFPEAASVLEDERSLTREDPDTVGEARFVTLGMSSLGRLLVVVWAQREADEIRLISAWKANARQRATYAQNVR